MSKYTIGIDLGGTTMTAGIVNESYEIIGKLTWATRLPRPAEDLEKGMADLCRTVARENKIDFADIAYVGIGTGQRELHHRLCRLQHQLWLL